MVRIKDRKRAIEYLRMGLNIAEIGVDYEITDLILRLQKELLRLKGEYSLKDGIRIRQEWKKYWEEYYEKLKEEENE